MYNGFVKLRRGLEEHLEAGKISYTEAGLYIRLMMRANFSTGVVYVSTNELTMSGTSTHQVRHALDRLEEKKYLRTFRRKGSKSRFAVLINKHERINEAASRLEQLNAFKSTTPKDLVWEFGEETARSSQCGGEDVSRSREESYTLPLQTAENTPVTDSLELRSKEVENLEEEKEENMSLKSRITSLAVQKLRTRIPATDSSWPTVTAISKDYSQDDVVDAFELFCDQHVGEQIAYPLSQFVRIVDGLIDGSTVQKTDGGEKLAIKLATIAGDPRVLFGPKQVAILARHLQTYTEAEISLALREFLAPISEDDFRLKNAAKTFCDTLPQLVGIKRNQDAQRVATETQLRAALEHEQAIAAQQLSERAAKDVEAAELAEEGLF